MASPPFAFRDNPISIRFHPLSISFFRMGSVGIRAVLCAFFQRRIDRRRRGRLRTASRLHVRHRLRFRRAPQLVPSHTGANLFNFISDRDGSSSIVSGHQYDVLIFRQRFASPGRYRNHYSEGQPPWGIFTAHSKCIHRMERIHRAENAHSKFKACSQDSQREFLGPNRTTASKEIFIF
jgi:hypothetical protein